MFLHDRFRIVCLCTDDRVDRRILDGARMFTEAGDPTMVIAMAPPGDLRDEESYPDVPIFRMLAPHSPQLEPPQGALEAIDQLGRRFGFHRRMLSVARAFPADVIIANDLPQLAAGIVVARETGAALIYDAHEFFPLQQFAPEVSADLEAVERALIGHADAVVTVNDSIADLIAMKYRCPRPPVILNCPSHRHGAIPARADSPLRGFLGVRPDQRVLLYQGGLSPFRNLDVLVESMARLPDDGIVLAMMGKDNAMGQQLRDRAQALGILGTRVMFVPEQPANALLPWTVGADAGIIPYPHIDINTWFMSPNKLFEFMSVGLPILAPHGPEVRRFVGDQGIGMNFHLATHDDFVRAITTFFAGPLDAWRTRAAEVAHQYTWETEGLKWFPILAAARAARDARLASATGDHTTATSTTATSTTAASANATSVNATSANANSATHPLAPHQNAEAA